MANSNIAIRFTEEKYATKNEVAKELKTSIVDTFWTNILAYRSTFNRYLTIKTIDKNMIVYCACQSITSNVNNVENKIFKVNREFSRLNVRNGDADLFNRQCLLRILKCIAKEHDLDVTENYINEIISGTAGSVSANNAILVRYLDAVKYIERNYVNPVNDEMIADLYAAINGISEITSFYRTDEDRSRDNRVIIDRIYTCAPVSKIDEMMESLISFISQSSLPTVVKAVTAYFYINYIRPFKLFSDEIALLVAKAIIAHESIYDLGAYLPFESLLVDYSETMARISVEVQKTNDITYFVDFAIKFLTQKCDELLDLIVNINNKSLRNDFFKVDEPVVEETIPVTYNTANEPVVETPIAEPIKEEVKQVEEELKAEEVEEVVEVAPTPAPIKKVQKIQYVQEELAVSYIPPALDEKEAYRLEQHLLESDPELKKGEARFFARHCVKGKKYTIQQYKKANSCAYETARTSMEHLVELGYYRKEQIKNKFVYTPIPR